MRILATCALLFCITQASAQWGDQPMADKPSFTDRFFTGGGLGGGFSSTVDWFSISPIVGYKLSQRVAPGISFMYRYSNYKYPAYNISTSDYGISPFVRVNVYGPFFLHVEYEHLNYEYPTPTTSNPYESVRKSYSSFLAGGGMFQPIGKHAGLYATMLYNFSYQTTGYSPYTSPIIFRVGITAGF